MRKVFLLILLGILVSSCSNDDYNSIDCSLYDPAFPELYIKLVDDKGRNLIDVGAVDPDDITVDADFSYPNFIYIPPDEYAEPDASIRKYDNTLLLLIPRESKFEYTININETSSFVLNFKAELTEIPCGLSYYIPTDVTFKNKKLELEKEESDIRFLTVVELTVPL